MNKRKVIMGVIAIMLLLLSIVVPFGAILVIVLAGLLLAVDTVVSGLYSNTIVRTKLPTPQPQQPILVQPPRMTKPVMQQPQPTPEPQVNPFDNLIKPTPQPAPEPEFLCKYCGKEMETEQKLRRHIGMAHYKELEI